ncbi:MAG: hypothetical protein ABIQ30_04730 [Devosia sp.]
MATWKALGHPLLPDLLLPDANGWIPLYSAAQWIALKGGLEPAFDPSTIESQVIWKQAFGELCDAITRGTVRARGYFSGETRDLPPNLMSRKAVSYPFRDMDVDLFEGSQMFLQSTYFNDDDDWNSGMTDTLWQGEKPIWTHIEVFEIDVRTRWPVESWGRVAKPTGRPPKRKVPIFAELDRLTATGVPIEPTIALAERVTAILNADLFARDPVSLRVVQMNIAAYLKVRAKGTE